MQPFTLSSPATRTQPDNPVLKIDKGALTQSLTNLAKAGVDEAVTAAVEGITVYVDKPGDTIFVPPSLPGALMCPFDPSAGQ